MTTSTRPPQTVRSEQATTGEAKLKARMWIGQNPMAYVAACLVSGYWFGRSTVRRSR